jgi:cephalosporin-C deacetylase-like acetyl esterase
MRILSIYLFSLALLATPKGAPAQQEVTADNKKTDVHLEAQANAAPPAENWGVLDDLKTGLQPPSVDAVQRDEQPDYVRELIRVQWRHADPIDLWIIRPKVIGKVPGILYLYNYTDLGERFQDNGWCKRASADGFAAVGFTSALSTNRFHGRPMKQWFVSELQESLGGSVHDVQLILNYLAARGDMDMNHVGMFGMGSGATIAILAAHADPRIKALDLLDPWGDWPDWLKSSPVVPDTERPKYLSSQFLRSVAALDPLDYLPSLKTPSFRLQVTLSDPATPDIAKGRLAKAVPEQTRIVKYTNAEDLLKAWKTSGLSGWIKQQMRSQKPKEAAMRQEGSTNAR